MQNTMYGRKYNFENKPKTQIYHYSFGRDLVCLSREVTA